MKNNKRRSRTPILYRAGRKREVELDIKSFLSALGSYPDRFARNPSLSFEQHLLHLAAANQLGHSAERRRS
jgi:hypothetical protein